MATGEKNREAASVVWWFEEGLEVGYRHEDSSEMVYVSANIIEEESYTWKVDICIKFMELKTGLP